MQNDCGLWKTRSMMLLLEHCSLGRTADTSDGIFLYFYIYHELIFTVSTILLLSSLLSYKIKLYFSRVNDREL